ncbi:MAG: hypothetical protein SNJ53_03410 [Thermodesulfovibrionales bacterium]
MAYVRCLLPETIISLCESERFIIEGWQVYGVIDRYDLSSRLITSDRAVEIRENKSDAVLLLIDTASAGSGLDGIYSAGREIRESELFEIAIKEAQRHIPQGFKGFCKRAVSRSRRIGTVSPWREFEFYTQCIDNQSVGSAMATLSLWPVYIDKYPNDDDLDKSLILVQQLILNSRSNLTVEEMISSLLLINPTHQQKISLTDYLRSAISKPFNEALDDLRDKPELWLNRLQFGIFSEQDIQRIEIIPWRGKQSKPLTWSGLRLNNQGMLEFNLNQEAKLEVRWKSIPQGLNRDAVQFNITVRAGELGEILSEKTLSHNGKETQKCIFVGDDFQFEESTVFEAKIHITVVGKPNIEANTEEFLIKFGEVGDSKAESSARAVRALIEGAIQIENKKDFINACSNPANFSKDPKGFIVFRHDGKNAKVYSPPLISRIDSEWHAQDRVVGRWTVQVRTDGTLAGDLRFIPCAIHNERLARASLALRRLSAEYKGMLGCIGISKDELEEYVIAWISAADNNNPELALINTVEVRSVSDRTIGLIVLPSHPLMIAWHSAYDHMLAYFRYDHEANLKAKNILDICRTLDGAYYPAFLPGIRENESFIFGDTLGFYAVAMVSDRDREPKATIALLARALSEGKEDITPTVGKSTSDALAEEIHRYIMLHPDYRTIHIHALRPGDGMTIGKALGSVIEKLKKAKEQEDDESLNVSSDINFVLNLYPASEKIDITGRFFQIVSQRRRTGSGVSSQDVWIFENSQRDGNITVPRLQWAKRSITHPDIPAHIATAFDTFESKVVAVPSSELTPNAPIETFGLHPCLLRDFTFLPIPRWRTYLPQNQDGEKHPASRALTERLLRVQSRLMKITALNIGGSEDSAPVLVTEIPLEKEESIKTLHSLSDWIVTIDKNAGIEYFDSPKEKPKVFEAYIIDCVPERDDLGFLQMVTSTANLDEVSNLLDTSLTDMGLSASPTNCIFLLNELKSLSGRLAMRLAGQGNQPHELIALSMAHANCRGAKSDDKFWLSLENGFFVPLDEVPYLLNSNDSNNRADLLYVTALSKGGLQFAFVEVKYRGSLKTARSLDLIDYVTKQIKTTRKNWEDLYSEKASPLERAIRYCRLARALRFYASKGRRHHLSTEAYNRIMREIDKMVSEGSRYRFPDSDIRDRGYIFCPEYKAESAALLSFDESPLIYLFGDSHIPDRAARLGMIDFKSDQDHKPSDSNKTTSDNCVDIPDHPQQEPPKVVPKAEISSKEGQCSEDVLIHLGDDIQSAEPVRWKISIKANPHLLLVGLPGMGKTTSLINICTQMFENGIVPIIFSYHNDIDERLSNIFHDEIHFVDYNGLGFNPLQAHSGSTTGFIDNVSMLRDIFSAIFPDLGDIQLGALREALKQSYLDKGWDINNPNTDSLQTPQFDAFYHILKENPKQDKALKGLLVRLDELNDYGFFSTSSDESSLFSSQKPVIIRIHRTQNDVLQKAFSMFVLHNLYKQMFIRGVQKNITHAVVFDEAHRAAKLNLIPTMAKECRKFGVSFVIASQEIRDFDPSIYNAIANYLVLRLNENDARTIARTIAPSEQVNLYTNRVKQMQKYHAFFFGEGIQKVKLIKLRFINVQ